MDPGWERGEYSLCHADMRSVVKQGEAVIDVVWDGSRTVVRSAFIVAGNQGGRLTFERYYFVRQGRRPIVYSRRPFRTRWGTRLRGQWFLHLWARINASYELVQAGARPRFHPPSDWIRMCSVSRGATTAHVC